MCVAQGNELDNSKWKVEGLAWFPHPTGSFHGANDTQEFDINKDFDFGNYSTISGKIDYRFGRKHHFIFNIAPVNSSKDVTLSRTIEFQGKTFDLGAAVSARISSLDLAPGYQYDILRRNHGYLALLVQANLIKTDAKITGAITTGSATAIGTASASILAPLPAVGPSFRWYPMQNSSRFSLDGSALGMSFFGYGNFMTAQGTAGIALSRHLNLRAGYQMGSRLRIKGTNDRLGVQLTQKGPIVGIEGTWGKR
jgi:hypothetical protein